MRSLLLFSFLVVAAAGIHGQAPTQPPAAQPGPARARAAQTARPARPAASRGGMAILVTNQAGAMLPDVHVQVIGPTERSGDTDAGGRVNLTGLQAGTYRLRFSGEGVIGFEREVTLQPGRVTTIDIALTPAPAAARTEPPPAPATPTTPAAPAPAVGPLGQPEVLSIPDVLEKEFVGKQARRESLLSCSGALRSTMIQINDAQPTRLYANADAMYYVLAGEGTVSLKARDARIVTNSYISVPRGTPHAFTKRGARTLVLLFALSGEACEQAK